MRLRDHPLMSYQGIVNWPPTWVWLDGPEEQQPKGELGISEIGAIVKDGSSQ